MSFEPKILGILCNWCAYAGGDLAGVSRIQYPPNMKVVRVMCTGRVDPEFVIEGFLVGCDGIWVGGWHIGECHYQSGNEEAINMVNVAKSILSHIGINPKRLLLDWVSAAEGPRFAQLVTDFTNQLRGLGPLDEEVKDAKEKLILKLKAARNAVKSEKLRWVAAKQTEFRRDGNKYGEVFTDQEIKRMVDGVVIEEITLQQILLLLEQEKLSVKEISQRLGISSPKIMEQVLGLRRKEIIEIAEIRGRSPLYALR